MKTILLLLVIVISVDSYSQTTTPARGRTKQKRTLQNNNNNTNSNLQKTPDALSNIDSQSRRPRQTVTDRYLKGPAPKSTNGSSAQKTSDPNSPFVGGIHPAGNAAKTFDTLTANAAGKANVNGSSVIIPGGNDTTFNVNTISENGITTNSGAVDRSGQSQFGQTNWGDGRGTVGESQWTVPPPITASFSKQFPAVNNATWTRNKTDTSIFSARYNNGTSWVTSNYNTSGERLDMRTEFPMLQPPRPVSVFIAKQPASFQVSAIYRLQVQGKPEVYEVQTKTGKTIYLNNDGMEVDY